MKPFFYHLAGLLCPVVVAGAPGTVFSQADPPVIRCPADQFQMLIFSPDSQWVAAAYYDLKKRTRWVGVWDATSLRPVFLDREDAGFKGTEALAFSPDKKQLLALGDSGGSNELLVWDTASGKRIKEQVRKRERHDPHSIRAYPTRELLRTADGRWLLHDATAGLVTDAVTGKVVHDYDKKYPRREPTVYGGIIVAYDQRGPEKVYDAVTGKLVTLLPRVKGGLCNFLHYSKDGMTRSVMCNAEGLTVTRGRPPRKTVIAFDIDTKQPDATRLSPDGRWLAVSYQYRQDESKPVPALFPREYEYQQIYDSNTGRPVGAPLGGMSVYFSPDGNKLAVVSKDSHVAIIKVPAAAR